MDATGEIVPVRVPSFVLPTCLSTQLGQKSISDMHRQDLRFEHETAWYPARNSEGGVPDVLSQHPKAKVWTAARAFVHKDTPVLKTKFVSVPATGQLNLKALLHDTVFCQQRCSAASLLSLSSMSHRRRNCVATLRCYTPRTLTEESSQCRNAAVTTFA